MPRLTFPAICRARLTSVAGAGRPQAWRVTAERVLGIPAHSVQNSLLSRNSVLMTPVFGSGCRSAKSGRNVGRQHRHHETEGRTVRHDDDDARVVGMTVHQLPHERQKAPLHVGETLALAVTSRPYPSRRSICAPDPCRRRARRRLRSKPRLISTASGASVSVSPCLKASASAVCTARRCVLV